MYYYLFDIHINVGIFKAPEERTRHMQRQCLWTWTNEKKNNTEQNGFG